MAKKKTKKKVVKKNEDVGFNDNGTVKMPIRPVRAEKKEKSVTEKRLDRLEELGAKLSLSLAANMGSLHSEINARIDRIVDAISKSKNVKGL